MDIMASWIVRKTWQILVGALLKNNCSGVSDFLQTQFFVFSEVIAKCLHSEKSKGSNSIIILLLGKSRFLWKFGKKLHVSFMLKCWWLEWKKCIHWIDNLFMIDKWFIESMEIIFTSKTNSQMVVWHQMDLLL